MLTTRTLCVTVAGALLAAIIGGCTGESEVGEAGRDGQPRAGPGPKNGRQDQQPAGSQLPFVPSLPLPPGENEALFGARIQRTTTLLATGSRVPVKIMFYGQSITNWRWTGLVQQELRRRYPRADLTVENRAIGGFGAQMLIHTAVHDVYPAYPDLLIYQVYGGGWDGTLEAFVSNVRRYTTSEIMLLTHHVRNPLYDGSDESSSQDWRRLAQKYDCELVDIRDEWQQYLDAYDLPRSALVAGDLIHLNEEGNKLMASLVLRHFRYNTLFPSAWADTVRTYDARRTVNEGARDEIVFTGEPWEPQGRRGLIPVGTSPHSALRLTFEGNRVDIIPGWINADKLGTARILIDGEPPSANPRLYALTRPSSVPRMWWPALLRVGCQELPLVEAWALRITDINEDGTEFSFEVTGSETGPDGCGTNQENFVSDSGRVAIDFRRFMFESASSHTRTPPPRGYEVRWRVEPRFVDVYVPAHSRGKSRAATVAMGLTNEQHTLEIIPNGDGPVPIEGIRVYRPPLK